MAEGLSPSDVESMCTDEEGRERELVLVRVKGSRRVDFASYDYEANLYWLFGCCWPLEQDEVERLPNLVVEVRDLGGGAVWRMTVPF